MFKIRSRDVTGAGTDRISGSDPAKSWLAAESDAGSEQNVIAFFVFPFQRTVFSYWAGFRKNNWGILIAY